MAETAKPLTTDDLVGGPDGSEKPQGGLMGRTDDVATGVSELKGKDLLKAAQEKAPNLSEEYVKAYSLTDDELRNIASGTAPPPPAIGPLHTSDLYLTAGGWQQTPPGVKPEDVGKGSISR